MDQFQLLTSSLIHKPHNLFIIWSVENEAMSNILTTLEKHIEMAIEVKGPKDNNSDRKRQKALDEPLALIT